MKTIKTFLIILLAASIVSQNIKAQEQEKQEMAIPLSKQGEPGVLDCNLVNGSISITGYDGNVVMIEATMRTRNVESDKSGKKDEEEKTETEGLRKISTSSFSLSITEKNNKIEIESDSWKQPIDLVIKVPVNFSLEIGTVNQGDIRAENINGNHEVRNVNGNITLENISGSVLANTVNGKISVVFETVEPETPMSFSNMNGGIDVTFPANVKATVKMKSTMGDIYTDFDMEMEQRRVKKENNENTGIYKISVEDWMYGKINGGGPEYTLKNFNNNIYLRKK